MMSLQASRIGGGIGGELAEKNSAKGRFRQFTPKTFGFGVEELAVTNRPEAGIGGGIGGKLAVAGESE